MTSRRLTPPKKCSVDGCNNDHWGGGLCQAHRRRWLRHGTPQAERPLAKPEKRRTPKGFVMPTLGPIGRLPVHEVEARTAAADAAFHSGDMSLRSST